MTTSPNRHGNQGLIFNIQRFSIHDGPGIRTTVFMKGCPLRCDWCSNPESQEPFPTLMARTTTCTRCGKCVHACPRGAITLDEHARRIVWEKCDRCFECVAACMYDSLTVCGRYVEPEEVLTEVLRDEAFYRNSSGGVTVSGGEPLAQARFVSHLLKLCKQHGLHTALDTTGYAQWATMREVLEFVDLALFDVKHLDSSEHRKATGVGNRLILQNLQSASQCTKVWVRIPLILGFNDSTEHVEEVSRLANAVKAEKISLLPYHEGGKIKCDQMGRLYNPSRSGAPSGEQLARLQHIIAGHGVRASIGM